MTTYTECPDTGFKIPKDALEIAIDELLVAASVMVDEDHDCEKEKVQMDDLTWCRQCGLSTAISKVVEARRK